MHSVNGESIDSVAKRFDITTSTDKQMICFASGDEGEEGQITNCNIEMSTFFDITTDSIQSRSATINSLLPSFVRDRHSQFMHDFRTKGKYSQIGHPIDAFVVKSGIPYRVELKLLLFPLAVKFTYVARIKLVGISDKYTLFNKKGQLQEYSPALPQLFQDATTNPQWNIFTLLPSLSNIVNTPAQNGIRKTVIHSTGFRAAVRFNEYPLSKLSVGVLMYLNSTTVSSKLASLRQRE